MLTHILLGSDAIFTGLPRTLGFGFGRDDFGIFLPPALPKIPNVLVSLPDGGNTPPLGAARLRVSAPSNRSVVVDAPGRGTRAVTSGWVGHQSRAVASGVSQTYTCHHNPGPGPVRQIYELPVIV